MNEITTKFNELKENFNNNIYDDQECPSICNEVNVLIDTMNELLTLLNESALNESARR